MNRPSFLFPEGLSSCFKTEFFEAICQKLSGNLGTQNLFQMLTTSFTDTHNLRVLEKAHCISTHHVTHIYSFHS